MRGLVHFCVDSGETHLCPFIHLNDGSPRYICYYRDAAPFHSTLRGKPGWGENMAYVDTLLNTFGCTWFDEKWNPTINTPEWKKAVTFYVVDEDVVRVRK